MEKDTLMIEIVSEDQKLTVDMVAHAGTVVMLGMISRMRIALDEIEDKVKENLKSDPQVKRTKK